MINLREMNEKIHEVLQANESPALISKPQSGFWR